MTFENNVVNWVHATMPTTAKALLPNGDDAALLSSSPRGTLVATDMLLDGTHFVVGQTPPELIGRKAVAVNFSDIAAMGGTPDSIFISLAVPRSTCPKWLERVMNGAAEMAREFNCGIDGGDTNSWNGPFAINVCVVGRPHWRGPASRFGAKEKDVVMVSGGRLGDTLASGHHLNFTPRIKEAQWLLDHFEIHSMMDLSDGLASDAPRLAKASAVKIVLEVEKIILAPWDAKNLRSALCDGEDFELFFTCSHANAVEIEHKFPWSCGIRRIGTVEKGEGVYLLHPNHTEAQLVDLQGYEH